MDVGGDLMIVSQFTLYSIMKGNKPDFHASMQAEQARDLFTYFVNQVKKKYPQGRVETGKFQALMEVGSVINGPVTIEYEKMTEEKKLKPKQKDGEKIEEVKKVSEKEEKEEKLKEVEEKEEIKEIEEKKNEGETLKNVEAPEEDKEK